MSGQPGTANQCGNRQPTRCETICASELFHEIYRFRDVVPALSLPYGKQNGIRFGHRLDRGARVTDFQRPATAIQIPGFICDTI